MNNTINNDNIGYFRRCNIDIEELSNKIDKYREEDIKSANKDRYMNLTYISWGFCLGSLGIASAMTSLLIFFLGIIYLIVGFVSFFYSKRFN